MERGTSGQRTWRDATAPVGVSRREFLIRAGALGLTGSALALFLQACDSQGLLPQEIAPSAPGAPVAPTVAAAAPTVATPAPGLAAAQSRPTPTRTPTQVPAAAATTAGLEPGGSSDQIEARPTVAPAAVEATPRPVATETPSRPVVYVQGTEERRRLGHLLRRAGFGASQQEMERYRQLGLDGTIEHLLEYERVDDSGLEERLAGMELDVEHLSSLQRWWFLRMVYTQRPLQEKMTLFWHGILTSAFFKVGRGPRMHQQNELFRGHALGRYDVLLKTVSRDPAMLVWLDSSKNRKRAPNENYARELMELFSMGVGTFSELDVREAARAFTGWFVNSEGFVFRANQHDNGVKVFLDTQGELDGDDVVDVIMRQRVTGDYMARRLFTYFVHDDPDPEDITALAGVFRQSGSSIKAMMRHILTSEEFYSARAYRAQLKSPVDLVAGAVRSLGVETDGRPLGRLAEQMGQTLFSPPDVAGWPGGAVWINSTTLLQRLNFAHTLSTGRNRRSLATERFFASAELADPRRATERFINLFLDGQMPAGEQDVLWAYMAALNGGGVPDELGEPALRGLAYLVMASPDYQVA